MLNDQERSRAGDSEMSGPELNSPAVATYAVFGNPVKHSKSPVIHAAFADQFGDNLKYRAIRVETDEFELKVERFFASGGSGLNVTVPFKERAFALADQTSDRAARARAANVLIPVPGGGLRADNTDGVALIRDMVANNGWQIAGRQTLVLGAGGAVRGMLQPLLREQPARVVIANRTETRARQLAGEFADLGVPVEACGFADIDPGQWDLVINGTSAGLDGDMPALPEDLRLSDRCCCYDMVYGAEPTPFMRWSAGQTAWAVADGLGMLVEQAAESYFLWRGQRPATGPVIAQLRQFMAS